ncbi:hypothetical protein KCU76_g27, partial [Aureobasidium melanogenum]
MLTQDRAVYGLMPMDSRDHLPLAGGCRYQTDTAHNERPPYLSRDMATHVGKPLDLHPPKPCLIRVGIYFGLRRGVPAALNIISSSNFSS